MSLDKRCQLWDTFLKTKYKNFLLKFFQKTFLKALNNVYFDNGNMEKNYLQ